MIVAVIVNQNLPIFTGQNSTHSLLIQCGGRCSRETSTKRVQTNPFTSGFVLFSVLTRSDSHQLISILLINYEYLFPMATQLMAHRRASISVVTVCGIHLSLCGSVAFKCGRTLYRRVSASQRRNLSALLPADFVSLWISLLQESGGGREGEALQPVTRGQDMSWMLPQ